MFDFLDYKDVIENFDYVYPFINDALPDVWKSEDNIKESIKDAIKNKRLQVWVYKNKIGDIQSILTTTVLEDPVTKNRNLLIYTIRNTNVSDDTDWVTGLEILKRYAIGSGCSNIVAYTTNNKIVNKATTFLNAKKETLLYWSL